MIVVADTTPVNYLVLIGHADVLASLYGRVIVPEAVYAELQHPRTPEVVRITVASKPRWLEVRSVTRLLDSQLNELDLGEQEAIALAEEIGADTLMIDEDLGRRAAADRHLTVIGTLGVLEEAAKLNLVDLPSALTKLRQTTFRASDQLLQASLQRDADRKKKAP